MSAKPVALITGAARGIGRATALEFARRGYNLGLLDVLSDELQATSRDATELGAECLAELCDLNSLEAAQASLQQVAQHFGRLDVLVNNAAWREIKTMREISVESWERTLRICLTTPAFLARWAAEVMEPQGSGVIINVCSIMSRRGLFSRRPFTGTGLAQPKIGPLTSARKPGTSSVPTGSTWRMGLRLSRPCSSAVGSPNARAARPCATSWKTIAITSAGTSTRIVVSVSVMPG